MSHPAENCDGTEPCRQSIPDCASLHPGYGKITNCRIVARMARSEIRDQSPRSPCKLLRADLALLHEAALGGTRKRLAIRADGLCRTGVFLALLHERGLGGACQRLAVLADSLGFAGFLREC